MIVIDFESLPDAFVAEITNVLAPALKLLFKFKICDVELKMKLLVAIPFTVTPIWLADVTFKTVATTVTLFIDVKYGFTAGPVIVTIGAGAGGETTTGNSKRTVALSVALPLAFVAVIIKELFPFKSIIGKANEWEAASYVKLVLLTPLYNKPISFFELTLVIVAISV